MIENVILKIGTPEYAPALFERMHSWFSIRQLTVYRFAFGRRVQPLLSCSHGEDVMLQHAQQRYISHFHHTDPLRPVQQPGAGVLVKRVSKYEIQDVSFREELYGRARIAGKLVFIVRMPHECLTLSLFRGEDLGHFTDDDMAVALPWGNAIVASLVRHLELAKTREYGLPEFLDIATLLPAHPPLSPREIAICGRVLRGMTIDGIAVDLGISTNSAVTYRRRAYAKLGIQTAHQLFALALSERRTCVQSNIDAAVAN